MHGVRVDLGRRSPAAPSRPVGTASLVVQSAHPGGAEGQALVVPATEHESLACRVDVEARGHDDRQQAVAVERDVLDVDDHGRLSQFVDLGPEEVATDRRVDERLRPRRPVSHTDHDGAPRCVREADSCLGEVLRGLLVVALLGLEVERLVLEARCGPAPGVDGLEGFGDARIGHRFELLLRGVTVCRRPQSPVNVRCLAHRGAHRRRSRRPSRAAGRYHLDVG